MPTVLVLYATKHGHTEKVARRIADAIEADGAEPCLRDIASAGEIRLSDFDAVVVGASIHAGKHQREVVEWVREHHGPLSRMPSAFFSVSMSAADDTAEAQANTRRYIDELPDDTGWVPHTTAAVAGALQYLEYDFATRLLVRLLMKKFGRPTEISHDYDYTDWDAVERFGHDCAAMVLPTPLGSLTA